MKTQNFSALTLLAAAALFTACSSNDEGQPSTPDSAVLDTATDTVQPDDTAIGVDSGEDDTSMPVDSAADVADAPSTETSDASCASGATETEACGKCGRRTRLCRMGAWLEWGACLAEFGVCEPGTTRDVPCERCGTRKETCTATCEYTSGACLEQKGCSAGSVETRTGLCLDPAKPQTRTCSETCTWSAWSDC